ncbi:ATP-binding protein [Actinoplanes sp. HUAS TT8]|uniref:ATP-binding protein n=1 Tax=Actinoplanes sp. HUAS TT8 TaxID=3447453 RepID=UPI003F5219B4
MLRVDILGPLRLRRDGVDVDTGPRQQSVLLGLLLARAGQAVGTDELIDLLWGDDVPASALNVIQKYVGALRRLLEPSLPARASGSYLHRRGNGYLFAADPAVLDLAEFRDLVHRAEQVTGGEALDLYTRALALWRGPAGDGLAVFAGLDDEFFSVCVTTAGLAVSLGRPDRVLPPLRLAAAMAPLHEPVHAALVASLAAAGHTADAGTAYRQVRARLADELGIDPGPALRAAHHRVTEPAADGRSHVESLVGRAEELAVLRQATQSALAGDTGLVLIEGEPGAGKTRLAEEAAGEADRQGAWIVWGHCLEDAGTPTMWPWTRAVETILDGLAAPARERWLAGELGPLVDSSGGVDTPPALPDSGSQFRLFETVVALLAQVAAKRPVLLVVDDLQWADLASLRLFGHLAGRLPAGVALLGLLRDRGHGPGSPLSRLLAAVSRIAGHRRVRLGPLSAADVAELVRRETGRDPGDGVTRGIHARTGGNPFFVQELARLLADDGVVTSVPSTVRDVVRDRVSRLDDQARDLLQAAALIGREVELGLLARVAAVDAQTLLDRIEPVEQLGLLVPAPGNPFALRFAHDLVRESVATTTLPHHKTELHLRVADALEATDTKVESVAERVAHHLWAAGPLADPARTADALICAGRRAASKSALEAAAQHLRSSAQLARTAGHADLELTALSLFTAVVGMGPGYASTSDQLERAEQLARELGREQEAVNFLISRLAAYCQSLRLDRAERLARQFREQTAASADPMLRAYGLHSWAIYRWAVGDISAAVDYQSRSDRTLLEGIDGFSEYSLRRDLHLMAAGMHAEISALHGDLDAARPVLDTLEAAGDDPYAITLWAAFASTIAALAGDPDRALRTAEKGLAEDPGFSFGFFGAHLRMNRCWARAVTGRAAEQAAAEAEAVLTAKLLDPPLTGLSTWYCLIAEMWLAADRPDAAADALDRAERAIGTYGERYAEGLLLLLRARLLAGRGAPAAEVRAAAEHARALSAERGAHLFARRADDLLNDL